MLSYTLELQDLDILQLALQTIPSLTDGCCPAK